MNKTISILSLATLLLSCGLSYNMEQAQPSQPKEYKCFNNYTNRNLFTGLGVVGLYRVANRLPYSLSNSTAFSYVAPLLAAGFTLNNLKETCLSFSKLKEAIHHKRKKQKLNLYNIQKPISKVAWNIFLTSVGGYCTWQLWQNPLWQA